ncbi:MAG: formylglycine-generating enzyme family protein [Kiritimatiellae bacterium]|nr:formylglycine-generating enzyme family protein [Kiritimatiellia bacterium]
MEEKKVIRMVWAGLAVCLALNAFAEEPIITNVVARQRWPWSRLVNIDYVLECADTQRVDVAVAGYSGTTSVILPVGSLSGDLYNVAPGARRIVWDPGKTSYTNELYTRFSVELTSAPVPLYMIVDLTKDVSATNQVTYLYPGDSSLVTTGRWTNVWFGVTNDVYRTDKLVLRRVSAGSYMMGANAGTKPVTLTQACYAGVFEVTGTQWYRIMGTGSSSSVAPVGSVSYNLIRGATNDVPAINWYATGSEVCPTSFIGRLRAKTGMNDFDLPTEAQWQYLCRAGTQSYYSDGVSTSASDTNILNEIGWWKENSSSQIKTVGLLAPNAWGLYDMHGNAWETCLDWSASLNNVAATNPPGPVSGTARVACGGASSLPASSVSCGSRGSCAPAAADGSIGFRIVRTLP